MSFAHILKIIDQLWYIEKTKNMIYMSKFNTCPFWNDVECTHVNIYMYFDILVENLVKFLKVSICYSPPCTYGWYFFKYGKHVHESTIGQNLWSLGIQNRFSILNVWHFLSCCYNFLELYFGNHSNVKCPNVNQSWNNHKTLWTPFELIFSC
jgi:hypothetical protein